VRFLVDAQLPPAPARLLGEHGHVAEHVADVGLGSASDATIWRYAIENDAVIITKDEDFPDQVLLGGRRVDHSAPLSRDYMPMAERVRITEAMQQALHLGSIARSSKPLSECQKGQLTPVGARH
jgi:hypothetical protein